MTFTDDDLKRLKRELEEYAQMDSLFPNALSLAKFGALLDRLETAEKVVANALDVIDEQDSYTWTEDLKTWRKAAGK